MVYCLLKHYEANYKVYEWLYIHSKGSKGNTNLASLSEHDNMCCMQMGRIKPIGQYTNNVTSFIFEVVTKGLFMVVLEDKIGGKIPTIGISRGLNVIYDCMEKHEMKLNHGNISKCCGPNHNFVIFCYTAELKDNRVHAEKTKIIPQLTPNSRDTLQIISCYTYNKLPSLLWSEHSFRLLL